MRLSEEALEGRSRHLAATSRPGFRRLFLAGTLSLALALFALPARAGDKLTAQEARGKQIYFEGISPHGEPFHAYIGEDLTEIPTEVATCASCHGYDGKGRPEAGVIPSDITWSYLFKPYGHRDPQGRRHPAFTVESLKDAILYGHDPGGNELDSSMPVFILGDDDLADLVAYLRRLETDFDPGVGEEVLRVGTILPRQGPSAGLSSGIREILDAYFEEINRAGGIHNRRLELVEPAHQVGVASALDGARELLEDDVFALVSPLVAGSDREVSELAEEAKLPIIGPVTLMSPDPYAINDFTFYLLSGLEEQVRSLVDFAVKDLGLEGARLVVVGPKDERIEVLREVAEEQGRGHGWDIGDGLTRLTEPIDAEAAAKELAGQGVEAILFLTSRGLGDLVAAGAKLGWHPHILLPGVFLERDLMSRKEPTQGRLYLAFPSVPADQTTAGLEELQGLLSRRDLPLRHRPSQVAALASAKVLVEGLKKAGRDLSRERLLRALESLYEAHTGLTPPITYGANRRIGALGAYVVSLDLETREFEQVGGWVTPQ